MWPTIIVASLVGIVFVAVIVNEIAKKVKGKPSCSCGGNCGACGLGHPSEEKTDDISAKG